MKRKLGKIAAMLLCLVLLLSAGLANAQVLSGYTSKVDYDNVDPNRYVIEVDVANQVITVYAKDATGTFSNVVLQGLCTTGDDEHRTTLGTFKIGDMKERFGYFVAYGQYAQYWTQVVRGIYIHSVMYNSTKLNSMSKSAYNGLGKALSHGCIRVMPEHAQWIYYNCPPGTTCIVTDKKPENPDLVKALKAAKPSYAKYKQPTDNRPYPAEQVATVNMDNVPLRTGFSASKDETVLTMNRGDHLKVLQIASDWCKVRTTGGKLGYVKTQYLKMNPDAPVQTVTGYAASGKTYLYADANTKADRLYTFTKGEEIRILEQVSSSWCLAEADGQQGYVRTKYLKATETVLYPEVSTVTVNAQGIVMSGQEARVRAGIVSNVRSGPGTQYGVIAELTGGTPIRLIQVSGENANWYLISFNGQQGYISASCVEIL